MKLRPLLLLRRLFDTAAYASVAVVMLLALARLVGSDEAERDPVPKNLEVRTSGGGSAGRATTIGDPAPRVTAREVPRLVATPIRSRSERVEKARGDGPRAPSTNRQPARKGGDGAPSGPKLRPEASATGRPRPIDETEAGRGGSEQPEAGEGGIQPEAGEGGVQPEAPGGASGPTTPEVDGPRSLNDLAAVLARSMTSACMRRELISIKTEVDRALDRDEPRDPTFDLLAEGRAALARARGSCAEREP